MNIRIQSLSLTNFKCFKGENNFDFGGKDIVAIRGRNGAGKTTIADAILFCLFGKNSEGQSDLELFKTKEDGKVIPNLDHSVEMELCIRNLLNNGQDENAYSAKTVTLKRSIKEVWVKKRGSEESVFKNNTVEYFVNGESYTKGDYEKYIAKLIDERVFRAITNPTFFPSLKWQDQREFLKRMAGSIEPECFADTDELKELVDYFEQHDEDLESYLKHLKYQIKQVKDKLEMIPVRLEEQNKALPERLDWDSINVVYVDVSQQLKEVESKIASIQQGNAADVKRQELRHQMEEVNQKMQAIIKVANIRCSGEEELKRKRISEASLKFNNELNNQKLMEQTIDADKRMIERAKETDYEAELQKLRDQWPSSKFSIDPNMAFCPTCGQPIPQEQYKEKVEQMRTNFNLNREAKIKELNEAAAKVMKQRQEASEQIKRLEQKLADDTAQLETIKQAINDAFAEKAKIEKTEIPTVNQILSEDVEYVALSKQLNNIKTALDSVTDSDDNREQLESLKSEKDQCVEDLSRLQQQLASRQQYDRILALIDGIKEEEKNLVHQLSELEKKEDIARQYQFRQNQLLEERINQHFKLVQWRLFRTVNNGGDSFEEPFCECYVDGIPYHSGLNQAARLNAGLDIINALCQFYNVAAPICLDNAESALNIIQTSGQQIRLFVSDCELQFV